MHFCIYKSQVPKLIFIIKRRQICTVKVYCQLFTFCTVNILSIFSSWSSILEACLQVIILSSFHFNISITIGVNPSFWILIYLGIH